jgi:hypothetical protein
MVDGGKPRAGASAMEKNETMQVDFLTKKQFNLFSDKQLFHNIFQQFPLVIIITLSLLVRIFAAGTSKGFVHPDEVFQTLEMVHYRLFGQYGSGQTIPWEFDTDYLLGGARSWFFILVLGGLYRIMMFLGVTDPLNLILGTRIILSLSSIITVLVSYKLGKMLFNKKVGLLAAFICGVWWFFPFWASRTLTDSIATDMLMLSIYFAFIAIKKEKRTVKRITTGFWSGIFLGVAFMLRFPSGLMGIQLASLMIVFGAKDLIDCKKKKLSNEKLSASNYLYAFSGVVGLIIGGLLMIYIQGMLDLLTWGSFLHSPINFFKYNISQGQNVIHGVSPWYFYFIGFILEFAGVTFYPIFVLLFVLNAFEKKDWKNKVILLSFVLFWLIIFSSIGHKEFRFLMPVMPLFVILIANGIYFLANKTRNKKIQWSIIGFFLILFVTFSGVVSLLERNIWQSNSGICHAMYWVGQQEDSKVLIVFEEVWYTGGYAYLDKNITCLFVKINDASPLFPLNSSNYRSFYATPGTYAILRTYELTIIHEGSIIYPAAILEENGMTMVAEIYGKPTVFVYANKN